MGHQSQRPHSARLLRVVEGDEVELSGALDAEDYGIAGLEGGEGFAQGVQRIKRSAIEEVQDIAGLETEERGVASGG